MRKTYQDTLWRFSIPVDTKFRDASQQGVIPSQLDPDTHGVRAYRHLWRTSWTLTQKVKERQHG